MHIAKIILGIAIIIGSFVYVLKNNTSMMDNLFKKTYESFEKKEAAREKILSVTNGEADAFDTIVDGVKNAVKPNAEKSNSSPSEQDNSEEIQQ